MMKLVVDYAIAVPAAKAIAANTIAASIVSNTAAFNTAMQVSYKAAEKARTGIEPVVEIQAASAISIETPAPTTTAPNERVTTVSPSTAGTAGSTRANLSATKTKTQDVKEEDAAGSFFR